MQPTYETVNVIITVIWKLVWQKFKVHLTAIYWKFDGDEHFTKITNLDFSKS